MNQVVLKVCGLRKAFGENLVLRGLDLELHAGSVTVIMGANGAGKSTLVNILCGYHKADEGVLDLDGAPYFPVDAADAIRKGVVTVHQSIDDGVVPDLDVASNLLLDRLAKSDAPLLVRARAMRSEALTVAAAMGLEMDVLTRVADLGIADRQMIAIARAMATTPKILILDEPTSSLSAPETERLFTLIERLRDQGVAILYVSHRMSDIRRIADRIICIRDGKCSGVFEGSALDYEAAVTAMLGRQIREAAITPNPQGKTIFEVNGITLTADGDPLDLTATEGEIIAIIGLIGSGKLRLGEIIFGLARAQSGTMTLDGKPYAPRNAREAVKRGVYLSPRDRASNAVIPEFDIADNMTLPFLRSFCHLSLLNSKKQRGAARRMIGEIGIVCQSSEDGIEVLSGGNQQKVMIGRWLLKPARVLLLDEPFQGVDIGARRDIARHIRATAKGRATIVFMAEIDEALEIADRIVILNEGSLAGQCPNDTPDMTTLVAWMSGRRSNQETLS